MQFTYCTWEGVLGRPRKDEPELGNEAAINESEVPVVVKLAIPPDLYALYEALASAQDLKPTELMLHRLQRCASHSSIRSLYFSESQLRQLEVTLQKKPIDSAEQAIALITKLLSVKIGDFEPVPLSAEQAKRIHLGAYGGMTPQEKLQGIVQSAVSKAVGI